MTRIDPDVRRAYRLGASALVAGRADLDGLDDSGFDVSLPILTVGQVAAVAAVHPQTLRQYDRLGIVIPSRTEGGARRYSLRDLDRLCTAQRLSQEESVNLAGILRILELSEENRQLRRQVRRLRRGGESSVFASTPDGEVIEVHGGTSIRVRREIRERTADYVERPAIVPELRGTDSTALVVWGARL